MLTEIYARDYSIDDRDYEKNYMKKHHVSIGISSLFYLNDDNIV